MAEQICEHFELLFVSPSEEDQGSEGEADSTELSGQNSGGYGLLPFMLTYVRVANESLSNTLNESAMQVFLVVQFELERQRKEEEMLRRMIK